MHKAKLAANNMRLFSCMCAMELVTCLVIKGYCSAVNARLCTCALGSLFKFSTHGI